MKPNSQKTIEENEEERKKKILERSSFIIGVDFTKANEQTGQESFQGKSLHQIRDGIQNPYQHVMTVLGKIFTFLADMPIAIYGFGDAKTSDDRVFNLSPQNNPCAGISNAVKQYMKIVPGLYLADALSFAPIIKMAIETVQKNQGKQHVLVIISSGLLSRDEDTEPGQLSCKEKMTVAAIEDARNYSLSIVLIGVGDKSGDMMRFFENNLSPCASQNFQVVNYTEIMSQAVPPSEKENNFANAFTKKLCL